MIKDMAIMIELTTADAVGTMTIVGEVEAEVGVTTINTNLWIRAGLVLEVEVTGTDHLGAELEEVGLEFILHKL
jgi:hypothetical protein